MKLIIVIVEKFFSFIGIKLKGREEGVICFLLVTDLFLFGWNEEFFYFFKIILIINNFFLFIFGGIVFFR